VLAESGPTPSQNQGPDGGPAPDAASGDGRTGADLPQQVRDQIAQARQRLLDTYPPDVVAARVRDLDNIAALADRLDAAAQRARTTNELRDVVARVRELSTAVNDYSNRYQDWRNPTDPAAPVDPGARDVDGVNPLDPTDMANRTASIDPDTHRFHVIDQAIAVAAIGNILGPEFEAHAARTFARTVPMDRNHASHLVSPNAASLLIPDPIPEGHRGRYEPRLAMTAINPMTTVVDRATGQRVTVPRSLSAIAGTLVHESMHSLQPNFHRLSGLIDANVPMPGRVAVSEQIRLEIEYQAFAVQQHFLRGLAGFQSPNYGADPRIPGGEGNRELAARNPLATVNYIIGRYDITGVTPDTVSRLAGLTPEAVVAQARAAIAEGAHRDPAQRRAGGLVGPVTLDIANRYGINVDAVRNAQTTQPYRPMLDQPPGVDTYPWGDRSPPGTPSTDGGPGPAVPESRDGPTLDEVGPGPGSGRGDPSPPPDSGTPPSRDAANPVRTEGDPTRTEGDPARPEGDPARPDADPALAERPNPALGSGYPAPDARTGADLPRQVRDMVDQARQRLLATYPEHVVADRLRDLDDIAALADMMDAAAFRARASNDVGQLVSQVRELSALVNDYSARYADWRDPWDPNAPVDPGARDVAGLNPLDPRELASRVAGVDPQTHRFHPIDQAIAAAVVGNILGPEFEAHIMRMLPRTIPLDPYHAGQLLPPADMTRLTRPLSGTIRGLYDPRSDVMFINPTTRTLDFNTGQPITVPRPLSAIATTLVHEGMHALQPGFDRMLNQVYANVPRSDVDVIVDRLRLEFEYQGFAVQQHFLRGLAGHQPGDLRNDPRLPASDRYRDVAGRTPEEMLNQIITGYRIDPASLTPELLARMAQETPARVVDLARTASVDNTHPDPRARRPGGLIGPVTRDIAATYGIDLDRLRYDQSRQYHPPLVDQSGGPSPGQPLPEQPLPEQQLPEGRHEVDEAGLLPERDLDPSGDQTGDQTGARIRPADYDRAQAWAEEAYERFRATPGDVDRMAGHLRDVPRADGTVGFRPEEIRQIRQHLFFDEHLLDDYEGGYVRGRFDPDADIAEAWIRLVEGRHVDADLVLLEHELAEATYMREHPAATYREAHGFANSRHDWESVAPERTGREDLDTSWGQVRPDGDTGGLREGPRGQSGGRIRFWVSGDGSPDGHSEGDPGGPARGRDDEPELPGGVRGDPAQPVRTGDVAGEGRVRGVAEGGDGTGTGEGDARTGETPAAEGPTRARVPFDFERFFNDPRWAAEATIVEQRLGAYYFNHPVVLEATRSAVAQTRAALMALIPRGPDETPEAFAQRVESVFFRDDVPDSAGQVGSGVRLDDLLAHGNVRELMTAFYNASYFNRDNPHTLARVILDIIDNGRWDQARAAGLDVDALRSMRRQLDGSVNRAVLSRVERLVGGHRFARDPFGTGNVVMLSEGGFRDLAEVIESQIGRTDRSPHEQRALSTTRTFYQAMNTPLGRFELAYVERVAGGPLAPDAPLPWREGQTAHDNTSGRWARRLQADGIPVVDGVSATTTRMLAAARVLGLGPRLPQVMGGLMAWMLPGRDHSLFEMMRGAQIAGAWRVDVSTSARFTGVDLFRSLPGLDLPTLRTHILPDGLFPHEARYLAHATDPNGFSESQHPNVRAIVARVWPQLSSGHVTDPDLGDWLRRNGVDPTNPDAVRALAARVSPAHVMALTVYTRHSHYLINNVTRTQLWTGGRAEAAVRVLMSNRLRSLVDDYLGMLAHGRTPLPLPLAARPVLHTGPGHLDSRSPLDPLAQEWVDANRVAEDAARRVSEYEAAGRRAEARAVRVEQRRAEAVRDVAMQAIRNRLTPVAMRLFDEMRWHADMVHDAMMQLPAVGSPDHPVLAFRGDWITPVHSPIYGSRLMPEGTAREFLSVSQRLEVAVRFMVENPASDRRIIAVYRLTGEHARDISVFSSFPEDQEAVLPPWSTTRQVSDPDLAEAVRAQVAAVADDMVRRGVIERAPTRYRVIIVEEVPRDG
jgi:hypothetical protein